MTVQTYSQLAAEFTSMVKRALTRAKTDVVKNPEDVARSMPALISMVNTVGYLRGQDGVLADDMPAGVDHKSLYAEEDACEKELNAVIQALLQSPASDYYRRRLESYFVKARTGGEPDVL